MSSANRSRSNARKRTRASFLFEDSTPSDPALFSSDPVDPGAEHYFSPRSKKQFRGTWWQDPTQARRVKREFSRNTDSGVFMASDGSEESLEFEISEEPNSDGTVPDDTLIESEDALDETIIQPVRPVRITEPAVISQTRRRIAFFAEDGDIRNSAILDDDIRKWAKENYNDEEHMSDLNLCSNKIPYLTDDMISPLFQMVKLPLWTLEAQMTQESREMARMMRNGLDSPDDDYEALHRDIRVDLSENALVDLPKSLFQITGLTSLNVGNNNLSTISQLVSNAKDLRALCLDGNRLRWLPGEVLDVFCAPGNVGLDDTLSVRHNPLVQPFSYVGFHKHFNSIFLDEAGVMLGGPQSSLSLVPKTLAGIKEQIERLEKCNEVQNCDQELPELAKTQSRWFKRLYEHYLAMPEILWMDMYSGVPRVPYNKEEQDMIIARWSPLQSTTSDCDRQQLSVISGQDAFQSATDNMYERIRDEAPKHTFLMAVSSVCYLDIGGRSSNSMSLPSETPLDQMVLPARLLKVPAQPDFARDTQYIIRSLGGLPSFEASHMYKNTPVRSLFSLCLKSASSVPGLTQLPALLPDDTSPIVQRGLEVAIQAQNEGGRTCSACKRDYIVPRAEWVEYHYIHHSDRRGRGIDEMFVPFLRRVCSWACVPHFEFDD